MSAVNVNKKCSKVFVESLKTKCKILVKKIIKAHFLSGRKTLLEV